MTPGGGFAIRPLAEGDDLQALLDLVRGVFSALKVDPPSSMARETIDDMRRRARTQTIFVAEADGALVGGVFCERQGDAFYIGRLAVIEPWRRRGVASALVGAATAKARELGLRTMSLRARVSLPRNVAFFERHGFRSIGVKSHPGFTEPTFHEMIRDLRV